MSARFRSSAGAFLVFALAACHEKEITSYRVPKDPENTVKAEPTEAGASHPAGALHWETPRGWQTEAASGLRSASFTVPGTGASSAEVSVVMLVGAGGDPLANINRWRAQLQLAPITPENLPKEVSAFDAPAGRFALADIRGEHSSEKTPVRILGAWLKLPGRTWYFKMMGPEDLVESRKDTFLGFLRSVAPGADNEPGAIRGSSQPAENTNDLPRPAFAVAPGDAAGGSSLRWRAPGAWQAKPATAMRKGSYSIGVGGAAADLSITAFPGDVGGLMANVNRWRDQVGLPATDASSLPSVTNAFEANGLHFTLVDIAGPAGPGQRRILTAVVPWAGATWFFKLSGTAEAVEEQKPGFLAFLQTVLPR